MSVLLKYQLKALFESGDLMTQDTLVDLIDSTYNPVLVAGTGVTLNSVTTPGGTTITINSTGGVPFGGLTTIGTSGAATLSGAGVLNIPIYTGGVGSYTNATPTPQAFPGNSPYDNIIAGTTFSNQTFTEMMNAMLYPTLDPVLTPPSSGLSRTPSATYQEINATITVSLNATFNRGSINPQYTSTSPFRSGVPATYNYTGAQVTSNVSSALTNTESTGAYIVLAGANTWTGSVSFNAGIQPKDSVGGNFGSPLSPGTTNNRTETITGVYPVFANTQVPIGPPPNTAVKQSLQSMTTTIVVDFASELVSNPSFYRQALDIPLAGGGQTGWSAITAVEQFNTFSGLWDPSSLSDWTTSATTHNIQGLVINYTRYTYNGPAIGSRKMRFKT